MWVWYWFSLYYCFHSSFWHSCQVKVTRLQKLRNSFWGIFKCLQNVFLAEKKMHQVKVKNKPWFTVPSWLSALDLRSRFANSPWTVKVSRKLKRTFKEKAFNTQEGETKGNSNLFQHKNFSNDKSEIMTTVVLERYTSFLNFLFINFF